MAIICGSPAFKDLMGEIRMFIHVDKDGTAEDMEGAILKLQKAAQRSVIPGNIILQQHSDHRVELIIPLQQMGRSASFALKDRLQTDIQSIIGGMPSERAWSRI